MDLLATVLYGSTVLLNGQVEDKEKTYGILGYRHNLSHKIVKVYEGGPAAIAGLLPGDKIKDVRDLEDNTTTEDGEPGRAVRLLIKRDENQFWITLVRVPFQTLNNSHLNRYFNAKRKY